MVVFVLMFLIILFIFLFWLFTIKLPKVGKGITNVGDKCYHSLFDKKHITKDGDNVSLIGMIGIGFKKFGKWFVGLFHKKNKVEVM